MARDEQPTEPTPIRLAMRQQPPRRKSWIEPGFDHIAEPCSESCATESGSHGRQSDGWQYAVVSEDGLAALVLTVSTDQLHGVQWPARVRNDFSGRDLSLHVAYPCEYSGECSPLHAGSGDADCEWLGKPCLHITYSTGGGAMHFWTKHGDPSSFKQGIGFWLALEEQLAEIDAKWGRTYAIPTEVLADRAKRDAWLAACEQLPSGVRDANFVTLDSTNSVTIGDVHRWLKEALK
jgi:hypothetical protein